MASDATDELVCLVYVSAAFRELTREELSALLHTCRANNASLDITGMLLYKGGNFLQLLEGPRHAVVRLFERIRLDLRHHRVTRLMLEPVEAREFGQWSMAFGHVEHLGESDREAVSPFLSQPFTDLSFGPEPRRALKLLLDFRRVMR